MKRGPRVPDERRPDGSGVLAHPRAPESDFDLMGQIQLKGEVYRLFGHIMEPVNGAPYILLQAQRKVPT